MREGRLIDVLVTEPTPPNTYAIHATIALKFLAHGVDVVRTGYTNNKVGFVVTLFYVPEWTRGLVGLPDFYCYPAAERLAQDPEFAAAFEAAWRLSPTGARALLAHYLGIELP